MFTGIVESMGTVQWLKKTESATQLRLQPGIGIEGMAVGDSLAVNGCCLTLTSQKNDHLNFDLLEETLRCTNLSRVRPGDAVNLERPLAANGRLGGHFVQGHVDCVAPVRSAQKQGPDVRLEIAIAPEFAHYVAYKGSIAINGVSLTVAEVLAESILIWIIPHTLAVTNLGRLAADSLVNVEFDILAKYLDRMQQVGSRQSAQPTA